MDKQTLRYTYLEYFRNQIAHNHLIDVNVLFNMAQNAEIAKIVIDELVEEGLIEGIEYTKSSDNSLAFISNEPIKLTKKGYNELSLKQIEAEQEAEIGKFKAQITGGFYEFNSPKMKELIEQKKQIIKKNDELKKESKDDVRKLSTQEKYHLIKKEILVFFYELSLDPCLLFDDNGKPYTLYKIRGKLNEIVLKYFKTSSKHLEYLLNQCLYKENLIKYRFGNEYVKNNEEIGIKNFIMDKGIRYLEEEYSFCPNKTLGELTEKEYISTYGDIVPRIYTTLSKLTEGPAKLSRQLEKHYKLFDNIQKYAGLNSNALKLAQQWENPPSLKAAREVAGIYSNIVSKIPYLNATAGIQNTIPIVAQKADNVFSRNQNINDEEIDKDNRERNSKNNKFYTFEGILGQNCGEVIDVTGADEKRLQIKGFKVENGIKVLRGYVKSSVLAEFSQPDNNYQRSKNDKHLNSLINFMESIKTSAKYLPEITLVARGYKKLEKVSLSGKLTDSQQGELDNLDYWKLTVNQNQLFRIDGNHRLEATKNSSYYVPFSIIIWNNNPDNKDDEAFLFYFLNSKAKKLTTEENIKGLVNAKTWNNTELSQANSLLPYIRYFKDNFEDHQLFKKEYYKNSIGEENAKIQILNVLEIILREEQNINEAIDKLSFDEIKFGEYITETQQILSQKDRFKYLRDKFRCFPQFVFYSLYKNNGDTEKTINFISQTNKWAKYYKHDSNSFIYADKMYNNASKQLNKKINIFVAMPYYDDNIIAQFNTTMSSIIHELKQENEILEEKLNLYPIMTYKAESTDILAHMNNQIGECDIFIADISNHGKHKVNPNVMFELGRVYDNKKFLLIRNKDNKVSNSAFDIQHIDYIPIDYGMGFDSSMKEKLKPRILNIIKGIIGFC